MYTSQRAYESVGQWPQQWQQPAQPRMWVRCRWNFRRAIFLPWHARCVMCLWVCVWMYRIAQTNRSWCDNQYSIESQKLLRMTHYYSTGWWHITMLNCVHSALASQSVSQLVNHSTVWFSFNVHKCHSFVSPHLILLPSKRAPKNIERIFPQYVESKRETEREKKLHEKVNAIEQ